MGSLLNEIRRKEEEMEVIDKAHSKVKLKLKKMSA